MDDLFASAALLTAYGMGTVFVFLTLLVLLTAAMSTILNRLSPVSPRPAEGAAEQTAISTAHSSDPRARAAIVAALHHHRQP